VNRTTPIAHLRCSTDEAPVEHDLLQHLQEVSKGAAQNAAQFCAQDWGFLAGLWHDLGKYRSGFQRYIRQGNDPDAHVESTVAASAKTHSGAGALLAIETLEHEFGAPGRIVGRILAYLIAGHHAGLANGQDLSARLALDSTRKELDEALAALPPTTILAPSRRPRITTLPPEKPGTTPGRIALWIRMLFSCLVDADFLDTEAFMDVGKHQVRKGFSSSHQLLERFEAHMAALENKVTPSPVNQLRAQVLRQCREKAARPPGVFTLTVPTGGGKTLASLGFALTHAIAHGKRRVVYAIPYTSIIEQTASIFRDVLGERDVIEHHSNAELDDTRENARSRLACENWDAPIVVTTNVQLFESLFATRTSRSRKLHNLVGSVIVLDEAHLLPVDFLQPVLDVLRLLVHDYGVTLVLCTATQPALTRTTRFDPRKGLRGFEPGTVTEIIDDVPGLYAALERVEVHRPVDLNRPEDWPALTDRIVQHEAVLTIVNRRQDARDVYTQLRAHDARGLYHLSALMCPAHRSDTIAAIKDALAARRSALERGETASPVRVVSTQLVEAGVDLDFPVVFRAMAGLDAIAQAAGRCNREGRLDGKGQVHVFVPPTDPPPGLLRQARDTCRNLWSGTDESDPIALNLFDPYFDRLYADADLDRRDICAMLRANPQVDIRFRDAADAFRLIDDKEGGTVIVRYPVEGNDELSQWIAMIERDGPARWLLRKLQRYGVTLHERDIRRLRDIGDIREVTHCPGLYVQVSDMLYDSTMGANVSGAPGDPAAYTT
jgi:CRISPR-associated endonuclease/helicase Cas3